MNCAFITSEVNGANPHDFQRLSQGVNMLSHLFSFSTSNYFCGDGIRRLKFHFKHERHDLFYRPIQPARCLRASSA